jgi:hypothetical protein
MDPEAQRARQEAYEMILMDVKPSGKNSSVQSNKKCSQNYFSLTGGVPKTNNN